MKIDKITYLNISTLYDTLVGCDSTPSLRGFIFGNKYINILNNISIKLKISDVTLTEYMFMKLEYSSVNIISDFSTDSEFVDNCYPEIKDRLVQFTNLLNDAREHTNIDYFKGFAPLGSMTATVAVTLSGPDLARLFGVELSQFFVDVLGKECRIDEGNNHFHMDKIDVHTRESLDTGIIDKFRADFYKSMYETCIKHDEMSEKFLNQIVFNNGSQVSLAYISNPEFTIDLINNPSECNDTLFNYKKLKYDESFSFHNTELTFVMNTPLIVFYELISVLPKESLLYYDLTNLITPKTADDYGNGLPDCPSELKDSFYNRFNGRLRSVINGIAEKYSDDANIIKRIMLSKGFDTVTYEIKLSLFEIEYYLKSGLLTLDDSTREFSKGKTKDIANLIVKFSDVVSKGLF